MIVGRGKFNCIVCERAVKVDVHDNVVSPLTRGEPENERFQTIHDATLWHTTGNYGSGVFDALAGGEFLQAMICDPCLKDRSEKGFVTYIKQARGPFPTQELRIFEAPGDGKTDRDHAVEALRQSMSDLGQAGGIR